MVLAEHLLIFESTLVGLELRLENVLVLENGLLCGIGLQLVRLLTTLFLDNDRRSSHN